MAYCSEADVQFQAGGPAKLLELLDQDGNGVADAGVLDMAIEAAESEMDPYLVKQVAVPMASPTKDVKWRCAKLAVFALRGPKGTLGPEYETERKAIMDWLEGVASGKIALASDPQPPKSKLRVDAAKKPTLRSVTRDKLKGAW
jgi:phage gp36-like protein